MTINEAVKTSMATMALEYDDKQENQDGHGNEQKRRNQDNQGDYGNQQSIRNQDDRGNH